MTLEHLTLIDEINNKHKGTGVNYGLTERKGHMSLFRAQNKEAILMASCTPTQMLTVLRIIKNSITTTKEENK